MNTIADNLGRIRERIAKAAMRAGRDPASITLAAVSKMQPEEALREAYAHGQRCFAENYAQHLRDKSAALCDLKDIKWHFIGHLQRNKVKYVISSGAVVETVDSVDLVNILNNAAAASGRSIDCMVQVNIGDESQKSGVNADAVEPVLEAVEKANRLRLMGLMIIPPWDLEPDETRKYFVLLRKLRDELGGYERLPKLSMGMSGDFEQAVEEGADIVRVGTAIFGDRTHGAASGAVT
jgi:pyridoxal phosphate enzyme (YggS family)